MKKVVIVIWLALLCVGCIFGPHGGLLSKPFYVYFFPDDAKTAYEPTKKEDIVIFPFTVELERKLTAEDIPSNYKRIGRLVGEGTLDVMEDMFLDKCAEWGCDAIQFNRGYTRLGEYAADARLDIQAVAYRAERKELTIKSGYTEEKLIVEWTNRPLTKFEGVYEELKRDGERIAIKMLSDREYDIIHISGKNWQEGDYRGKLFVQGASLYRVEWFVTKEYSDSNYHLDLLKDGLILRNGYLKKEVTYIQIYPYSERDTGPEIREDEKDEEKYEKDERNNA